MIRYFCDRCTVEVHNQHALFRVVLESRANDRDIVFEVCNNCRASITEEVRLFNKELKNVK